MSKIHALRVGLAEGADFMGAYVRPKGHSPGYAARKYGVFDYGYTDYPDLGYRLNERSRLEKILEVVGVVVGATSNICLFLPQIAAYVKRESNKENHRATLYQNWAATMINLSGNRARWGEEQEQIFCEKLQLIGR